MRTFDCGEGEAIVLGEKIVVRVTELRDEEVCLEISVPEGVAVSIKESLDAVVSTR